MRRPGLTEFLRDNRYPKDIESLFYNINNNMKTSILLG